MEYIWLALGFVMEVLDACEGWEGRDGMPMKLQELMMVMQIEADARRSNQPRQYHPEILMSGGSGAHPTLSKTFDKDTQSDEETLSQ